MDVLLPSAGSGLSGLNVGQLPPDLNGWLQGLTPREVEVSLPKFQMTTQFKLNQQLEDLGMTDAFGPADFSGISTNPLYISSVIHKAFINVDETGTEAAAATAVIVNVMASFVSYTPPPVVFNADHPFLFLIRDTQSGSVLFMGQVANPSTTSGDSSAPAVPNAQLGTPPSITSTPVTQASVGSVYTYQVTTNPSPSQEVTFSLGSAPAGMNINASTGLITWTPSVFQTGPNTVTVLATDQSGDAGQQTFSISVSGEIILGGPFSSPKWDHVIVGPVDDGMI